MKIAVMGYSGSGKSTLAQALAKKHQTNVLHFDTVQFLPNWEIRSLEDKQRLTEEFLDTHDSWVIDGNYSKLSFDRRMREADTIVLLLFNRFSCFCRAYRRYLKYKNTSRPDMAEGCNEKFDLEFASWILWQGRGKTARDRYNSVIAEYGNKVVIIKNQRQLDAYMQKIALSK